MGLYVYPGICNCYSNCNCMKRTAIAIDTMYISHSSTWTQVSNALCVPCALICLPWNLQMRARLPIHPLYVERCHCNEHQSSTVQCFVSYLQCFFPRTTCYSIYDGIHTYYTVYWSVLYKAQCTFNIHSVYTNTQHIAWYYGALHWSVVQCNACGFSQLHRSALGWMGVHTYSALQDISLGA